MNKKLEKLIRVCTYKNIEIITHETITLKIIPNALKDYIKIKLYKDGDLISQQNLITYLNPQLTKERVFGKKNYKKSLKTLLESKVIENMNIDQCINEIEEKEKSLKDKIKNIKNLELLFQSIRFKTEVEKLSPLYKRKLDNITTNTGYILDFDNLLMESLSILTPDCKICIIEGMINITFLNENIDEDEIIKGLKDLIYEETQLFESMKRICQINDLLKTLKQKSFYIATEISSKFLEQIIIDCRNNPDKYENPTLEVIEGEIPGIALTLGSSTKFVVYNTFVPTYHFLISPNKNIFNNNIITNNDLDILQKQIENIISQIKIPEQDISQRFMYPSFGGAHTCPMPKIEGEIK